MGNFTPDPSQMVSSTDIAQRFEEYLDRARSRSERLFITRDNSIEAVLISIEDFEKLSGLEELVEHLMVAKIVEERLGQPEVADLGTMMKEEALEKPEKDRPR